MTDAATPETSVGGNSVDPETLKNYISLVEKEHEKLLSEQGAYMQECSVIHGRIKALKKEAKGAGISLKEFNTLLKDRELDRKKAKLRTELEPDQLMLYDKMKNALRGGHKDGGLATLPLGQHALEQAAPTAEQKADPIDSIGRGLH
jgi:uncharacterized protein (UPF0335 family)